MMVTHAFAFFDRKGGFFSTPFFFPVTPMAMRAAADLAQDARTTIGQHPADYDLFKLGLYDDASGTFSGASPEFVCNCQSLVNQTNTSNGETSQ